MPSIQVISGSKILTLTHHGDLSFGERVESNRDFIKTELAAINNDALYFVYDDETGLILHATDERPLYGYGGANYTPIIRTGNVYRVIYKTAPEVIHLAVQGLNDGRETLLRGAGF